MHPSRLLRVTSIVEACTWFFLIGSIVVRNLWDEQLGGRLISWAGSAHGAAFIAFVVSGVAIAAWAKWPFWAYFAVLLASVLPFCTLLFDWCVHRRLPFEPRGSRTARMAVNWLIAHPFTLSCSAVALFSVTLASAVSR